MCGFFRSFFTITSACEMPTLSFMVCVFRELPDSISNGLQSPEVWPPPAGRFLPQSRSALGLSANPTILE